MPGPGLGDPEGNWKLLKKPRAASAHALRQDISDSMCKLLQGLGRCYDLCSLKNVASTSLLPSRSTPEVFTNLEPYIKSGMTWF